MKFRPLVIALVLAAIAANLARALGTHDDVGPLEYITGVALLVALVVGALRFSRRAIRRA